MTTGVYCDGAMNSVKSAAETAVSTHHFSEVFDIAQESIAPCRNAQRAFAALELAIPPEISPETKGYLIQACKEFGASCKNRADAYEHLASQRSVQAITRATELITTGDGQLLAGVAYLTEAKNNTGDTNLDGRHPREPGNSPETSDKAQHSGVPPTPIENDASHSKQVTIGKWSDDAYGKNGAAVISIYRENRKLFIETRFSGVGILSDPKDEAVERSSPGGRRFQTKEASNFREYFVIDNAGNLGLYDRAGFIRTAKKLR
jgi:hypothetical protein